MVPAEHISVKHEEKIRRVQALTITLFAWDPQLVVHKVKPLAAGGNPDLQAQHPSQQLESGPLNSENLLLNLVGVLLGSAQPCALGKAPQCCVSLSCSFITGLTFQDVFFNIFRISGNNVL